MTLQIHRINRQILQDVLAPGDLVCDATCGNGHDTLFLAREVLPGGHVYAIDIQTQALASTQARLHQAGYLEGVTYLEADHKDLKDLLPPGLALVFFNLGYLPGSDHRVRTQAESSLLALQGALNLLRPGGMVSLMLYQDPPQGLEEAQLLLRWGRSLDPTRYTVLEAHLTNMPNRPPHQVFIQKRP